MLEKVFDWGRKFCFVSPEKGEPYISSNRNFIVDEEQKKKILLELENSKELKRTKTLLGETIRYSSSRKLNELCKRIISGGLKDERK